MFRRYGLVGGNMPQDMEIDSEVPSLSSQLPAPAIMAACCHAVSAIMDSGPLKL